MIIMGYQGIGKSRLANQEHTILNHGAIDLESSSFWVNGERNPEWYKIYCNIAHYLSQQGYIVFTSAHAAVQEEFKKYKDTDKIICIFPSLKIKDEWLQKLEDRYNNTHLEKDYRALLNAKQCYDENIKDLMNNEFDNFIITDPNYNIKHFFTE